MSISTVAPVDPQPLGEVVAQLDQFPVGDRFEVCPTIFAVRPWTAESPSVVLQEDATDRVAPSRPTFSYLIEVALARDVLKVWSAWRDGAEPSTEAATTAIIYYATNDAYVPVE